MRTLKSLSLALLIWLVSFPLFMLLSFAVRSLLYPALLEWFPSLLPEYNFVTEREEYEAFYNTLALASAILCVLIVSYLSVRYNNERMEFMITETEGMYSLAEGAALYYPRYFRDDVAVALILPLPILLLDALLLPSLGFLPDGVLSLIGFFFEPTRAFTSSLGAFGAYITMSICFFVFRCLSALRAIDVYRALWLSEIEYMG